MSETQGDRAIGEIVHARRDEPRADRPVAQPAAFHESDHVGTSDMTPTTASPSPKNGHSSRGYAPHSR